MIKILLDPSEITGIQVDETLHGGMKPVLRYLSTKRAEKTRTLCDYGEADGRRLIDESVRKCNKFTNVKVVFQKGSDCKVLEQIGGDRLGKAALLEYGVDGVFDEHTDTKDSKNHIGTLILIPPKTDNSFIGGTLYVAGKAAATAHDKVDCYLHPIGPGASSHKGTKR